MQRRQFASKNYNLKDQVSNILTQAQKIRYKIIRIAEWKEMNESQMNSAEQVNIMDEFLFEVKISRQKLAEQFLVDIKSVEEKFSQVIKEKQASGQLTQEERQRMSQQQVELAQIYQSKIQQLEKLQNQTQVSQKRYQNPELLQTLEYLKQQAAEIQLPETIGLYKELIQKQVQTAELLQSYLDALCERIKHQHYSKQQLQIYEYLQAQLKTFKNHKEQIRGTITKVKKQRQSLYNKARKLCRDKQQEIQKLQEIKTQKQKELQKQKEISIGLNDRENQLYKEISNLTLSLNKNLLTTKSEVSEQNKGGVKSNHHASQRDFKSKNFGSIIEPKPYGQKENPSMIFPSQISSQTENKTPVCQVSSNIEKQVNNKKYIILILFILTIGLWFV